MQIITERLSDRWVLGSVKPGISFEVNFHHLVSVIIRQTHPQMCKNVLWYWLDVIAKYAPRLWHDGNIHHSLKRSYSSSWFVNHVKSIKQESLDNHLTVGIRLSGKIYFTIGDKSLVCAVIFNMKTLETMPIPQWGNPHIWIVEFNSNGSSVA